MIASAVTERREEIEALCVRYHVRRLEVFGSATGDDFDPNRSDVDFLVEFGALEPVPRARAYFGLRESLGGLLERRIDLVEAVAVRNPYIRESIDASREALYEA